VDATDRESNGPRTGSDQQHLRGLGQGAFPGIAGAPSCGDGDARAARDVGNWELAEWAGRQMVEHDPNYAGSHYALALVAEHRGDAQTARAERALVSKYWKNADPDLAELRTRK